MCVVPMFLHAGSRFSSRIGTRALRGIWNGRAASGGRLVSPSAGWVSTASGPPPAASSIRAPRERRGGGAVRAVDEATVGPERPPGTRHALEHPVRHHPAAVVVDVVERIRLALAVLCVTGRRCRNVSLAGPELHDKRIGETLHAVGRGAI